MCNTVFPPRITKALDGLKEEVTARVEGVFFAVRLDGTEAVTENWTSAGLQDTDRGLRFPTHINLHIHILCT